MPSAEVTSVPYRAGTEGYACFRIPAAVATTDGTLLAFAEGRRHSAADHGDIDIVLRRSADGGRSWGPMAVVAANGSDLAGNPAPVATADGGVLLLQVHNPAGVREQDIRRGRVPAAAGRRIHLQHSEDHGRSWSRPKDVTASVKRPWWRWYATGPGHAVELTRPPYAGRIVVPANHSLPSGDPDRGRDGSHVLLSDDGGGSWRIGCTDHGRDGTVRPNETTAAELPDGRLYLNTRSDTPSTATRAEAYSRDGGQNLDLPFRPRPELVGPVVQGSVLHLGDSDALLFSAPAAPGSRAELTVRIRRGGGPAWHPVYIAGPQPAGYSDLVPVGSDVGLLYETGETGPYERIAFRCLPRADLVG